MKEKVETLLRLMDEFTAEEKDRIMEIIRLSLEITRHEEPGLS